MPERRLRPVALQGALNLSLKHLASVHACGLSLPLNGLRSAAALFFLHNYSGPCPGVALRGHRAALWGVTVTRLQLPERGDPSQMQMTAVTGRGASITVVAAVCDGELQRVSRFETPLASHAHTCATHTFLEQRPCTQHGGRSGTHPAVQRGRRARPAAGVRDGPRGSHGSSDSKLRSGSGPAPGFCIQK